MLFLVSFAGLAVYVWAMNVSSRRYDRYCCQQARLARTLEVHRCRLAKLKNERVAPLPF